MATEDTKARVIDARNDVVKPADTKARIAVWSGRVSKIKVRRLP